MFVKSLEATHLANVIGKKDLFYKLLPKKNVAHVSTQSCVCTDKWDSSEMRNNLLKKSS